MKNMAKGEGDCHCTTETSDKAEDRTPDSTHKSIIFGCKDERPFGQYQLRKEQYFAWFSILLILYSIYHLCE